MSDERECQVMVPGFGPDGQVRCLIRSPHQHSMGDGAVEGAEVSIPDSLASLANVIHRHTHGEAQYDTDWWDANTRLQQLSRLVWEITDARDDYRSALTAKRVNTVAIAESKARLERALDYLTEGEE